MKKNQLHNLAGEKKDQLLVVADKNGKPKGLATRELCHQGDGISHLAFMAFIIDKNNKIILAKRSNQKSLWAGVWDASVVSHVLDGETPQTAANRRVKEEMGIEMKFVSLGAFYYLAKQGGRAENEYCFVLKGTTTGEIYPNPVEIGQIKRIKAKELDEEITKLPNIYTPWLQIAWKKLGLSRSL